MADDDKLDVDEIIRLGNKIREGSTFKLSDDDNPTKVKYWIPTGIYPLDVIMSSKKNGGLPGGKIIEVAGKEATGKTMLAGLAMKSAMDRDIKGIYIDTEGAVSPEFFKMLGINVDKMAYVQLQTVEVICSFMEDMIEKLKNKDKNTPIYIVWDSIAQSTTEEEAREDYDDYTMAAKARRLSQAFRKMVTPFNQYGVTLLMTNQLRQNVGGGPWESKYVTPGGMAIPYASSLRIMLKNRKTLKSDKTKEKIGVTVEATTRKNRITIPHRSVKFDMYYNVGVDNKDAMYRFLKKKGFIKTKGSWKKFTLDGEKKSFQSKDDWYKMMRSKDFYEKMKDKVFEYSKKVSGLPGDKEEDLSKPIEEENRNNKKENRDKKD